METVPNPEMLVIPYRDKQNVYSCWWLNCGIGRILQKISCCQENIKNISKATYNTFSGGNNRKFEMRKQFI